MGKGPGRPPVEYDLEKVEKLASRGLTNNQIADALDVGRSTFYKDKAQNPEFLDAIKRGKAKGIATITNALFEQAINGNTASAIFWLKNQAGWRDKLEMTGENGGPVKHHIVLEPHTTENADADDQG